MFRSLNKNIIFTLILLIALWDVFTFFKEDNATFSVIITDWSWYSPWMPFLFGVLMGHWFWPAKGTKYDHVGKT